MSVRVANRNLSTMEYIYQAHQLVQYVADRLNKYEKKLEKDKKYKDIFRAINLSLWSTPVYNAQMVYTYVQRANSVHVLDRESLDLRSTYLENALNNLNLLETSITTLRNAFGPDIKDRFLIELSQKIDYERKLIKGSDIKRGTC